MAWYDDVALSTRKSVIVVTVCVPWPAIMGSAIMPTGWTTLLKNPFRGVGVGCNRSGLMLILVKASQNKMSVELPLLTKICWVV